MFVKPIVKAELPYKCKIDVQLMKGLVSTCVIYVQTLCGSFESLAVNTAVTPHPSLPGWNMSILRLGHHLHRTEELLMKRSEANI